MELGIDPVVILRLKLVEKIGIGIGLVVLVIVGYWYFYFQDRQMTIESLDKKIEEQTNMINMKERQRNKLPELKKELERVVEEERVARTQLPSSREIPSLLKSISTTGHGLGLEFLLFDPQDEEKKNFYAEVPVDIELVGTFANMAQFLEEVSQFSRIVSIGQLEVKPLADGQTMDAFNLSAKARATTYRYIEQETKEDKP